MDDAPLRFTILHFDSLPSTNDEAARQAARGAAEGLCVVAREQTAGRGRQARAWASPKDAGLYFSVVLRPRLPPAQWPLITLAAALAVRAALADACALTTDIKWPNDLLADGRKLCGILAEVCETERGRACVLGIGINLVDAAYQPELRAQATSVAAAAGRAPDRAALLAALTRQLAVYYERLHAADGVEEIIRSWCAASSYAAGKRVRVETGADAFAGTTRGLEPDGALRVETETGELKLVRAGDVRALRQLVEE
ncbi:MAG TPA: biotin--[acetyl-CoA-carboxylase] ligase [Pyrinomonadaceae bacterium]|jgi:BirA family biotin operon repressor/biotin-[acetyl-CoA-carboxylase] ligase